VCTEHNPDGAQIESKTVESLSSDGQHLSQTIDLNLLRRGQGEHHQMQFDLAYAGVCPVTIPKGMELIKLP
jgi:hypothetical protein